MANTRYTDQRARVTPPHVSIGDLRRALGLTLNVACERFEEVTGTPLTVGALSGIENGHRGASAPTLAGLAAVYGLPAAAVTTNYQPRERVAAA